MNIRSKIAMTVTLCALAAMAGCATLTKLVSSPEAPAAFMALADGAVGVAVGKGVSAQAIATIATQLQAFDSGTTVTIPALTAELTALENKAGLNVGEQAAITTLVTAFSGIIQAQTQNGTINATAQATIQQILTDVVTAAELFGAQPPAASSSAPAKTTDVPAKNRHFVLASVESPQAVGAATSLVIVGALQAFKHISVNGSTAAAITVLATVASAALSNLIS